MMQLNFQNLFLSPTIKIRKDIVQLASQMERVIPEPDVTTKQGRLKSGKFRHEPMQTVEDLAKLEVLDEVCKHGWGRTWFGVL